MTRAARRLHVVQSAVSQAIKRLEQEYGLQLLERRSDGVYPTAAGIELGHHAQRILDSVARLEEDMASYRGHSKGVANVGVVSTLAATLVAPLVRAADHELPEVKLRVKEGVAGELLEALRLARLDLVAVVSPVEVEELTFVSTGELDLYFIVPPGHSFADRDEVAFADSAGELWISFSPSNPARRWLDDNSRKAGFRPLIAAEIETFTQMKAFVEAGHGITLAPRELVAQELELGVLVAVHPGRPRTEGRPRIRLRPASGAPAGGGRETSPRRTTSGTDLGSAARLILPSAEEQSVVERCSVEGAAAVGRDEDRVLEPDAGTAAHAGDPDERLDREGHPLLRASPSRRREGPRRCRAARWRRCPTPWPMKRLMKLSAEAALRPAASRTAAATSSLVLPARIAAVAAVSPS